MNDVILIIIGIVLFFFGYEIRPWIVTKYPESRHLVDLMVMVVTFTTFLVPLISLIASGQIAIEGYFIISYMFIIYLVYYGWKHKTELKRKSRKMLAVFIVLYVYIFAASGVLIAWAAPFMSHITLFLLND